MEGAKHLFAAENKECVMSETQAYSTGAVGCGGCVWVCGVGGCVWGVVVVGVCSGDLTEK